MRTDNIIPILADLGIRVRRDGDQILAARRAGWAVDLIEDVRFCRPLIKAALDQKLSDEAEEVALK